MNEKDMIASLKAENEQLKKDNATLQKTIEQMRVTLDRMIARYISGNNGTA